MTKRPNVRHRVLNYADYTQESVPSDTFPLLWFSFADAWDLMTDWLVVRAPQQFAAAVPTLAVFALYRCRPYKESLDIS